MLARAIKRARELEELAEQSPADLPRRREALLCEARRLREHGWPPAGVVFYSWQSLCHRQPSYRAQYCAGPAGKKECVHVSGVYETRELAAAALEGAMLAGDLAHDLAHVRGVGRVSKLEARARELEELAEQSPADLPRRREALLCEARRLREHGWPPAGVVFYSQQGECHRQPSYRARYHVGPAGKKERVYVSGSYETRELAAAALEGAMLAAGLLPNHPSLITVEAQACPQLVTLKLGGCKRTLNGLYDGPLETAQKKPRPAPIPKVTLKLSFPNVRLKLQGV